MKLLTLKLFNKYVQVDYFESILNYIPSNRHLIIFSLSPLYLLISDAAEQLKKVDPLTPATAFASIVFPVPKNIDEIFSR